MNGVLYMRKMSSGSVMKRAAMLVMLVIACVLLYLAIVKKFEPLLLCGIAFGCLLSNLPGTASFIVSRGCTDIDTLTY